MAIKDTKFPVTHHYELIDDVAKAMSADGKQVSKADVWRFYHAIMDAVAKRVNAGNTVMLPGIEKIELVHVGEHQGVKPVTGEKITVPEHVAVKIRPLSKLSAVRENVKVPEGK